MSDSKASRIRMVPGDATRAPGDAVAARPSARLELVQLPSELVGLLLSHFEEAECRIARIADGDS